MHAAWREAGRRSATWREAALLIFAQTCIAHFSLPPFYASAVTDPAFLVTRPMEDFVTWVDTSRIRRKVQQYNDRLDDYELLQ